MANTRPDIRTLAAVTADVLAVAATIAKGNAVTVQLMAPVIEELKREAVRLAGEAARKELGASWTTPPRK